MMKLIRLLLFPILSLLMISYISVDNIDILRNKDNVARLFIKNFKQGYFGYGIEGKYNNFISFSGLEPGDILVGGYPECAYGRFSHAGLYMGNNLVLESYGDLGITIQPIYHFWDYSEVALLKVHASIDVKQKVVDYIKEYEGGLFYPIAFKPGDRIWNCSKIIWKAYHDQGIELDESGDLWIAPQAFYDSDWTSVIREKGR